MSSYVESPYVIRQRELQGIITQCCNAIDGAKNRVADQRSRMNKIRAQRADADRKYISEKDKENKRYSDELNKKHQENEKRRQYLVLRLKGIVLEIEAYKEVYGCYFSCEEELKRQQGMVSAEGSDIEGVEEEIALSITKARREMFDRTRELAGKNNQQPVEMSIVRKEKMKALEDGKIEDEDDKKDESPAEKLVRMVEKAKASSHFEEVFAYDKIISGFYETVEYERDIYALKNMDKLQRMCNRIKKLEESRIVEDKEKEEAIKKYIALCGFLNMEADEELLSDPDSSRKIDEKVKQMTEEYIERKKREYVAGAIRSVMEKRNIRFQDSENPEEMFFVRDNTGIIVTGYKGERIEIQQVGLYSGQTPSSNDKRKSVNEAKHFCSLFKEIEEELHRDYGVSFGAAAIKEPEEESIVMCHKGSGDNKTIYHAKNVKYLGA